MTRWSGAGARRSKRAGSIAIRCAPAMATLSRRAACDGSRSCCCRRSPGPGASGRCHKKLTDWARQALLQVARWLPDRRIVAVADSSYAVIDLLNAVRHRLCVIARLRLDARLFEQIGRAHV